MGIYDHTITYYGFLFFILLGLPARHFSYVKNIDPGLPLFLFNYTDRKLHGIFEASSMGKMYIDPYAWINDDYSNETQYPVQVHMLLYYKSYDGDSCKTY